MAERKRMGQAPSQSTLSWDDDFLSRSIDAAFLERFLRNRSSEMQDRNVGKALVMNLNAAWGEGKSFFLRRLRQQMSASGHITVYIDAWEDDFAEDPLTAVMAAIDAEIQPYLAKNNPIRKAWRNVTENSGRIAAELSKGVGKKLLSAAVTESTALVIANIANGVQRETASRLVSDEAEKVAATVVETLSAEKAQSAIDDFRETKAAISDFRQSLAFVLSRAQEKSLVTLPLVVIVDELDRCRPPYALALLERMKHLFTMPQVAFVVATHTEQLAQSVKAVYGSGFAAEQYLHRFFDHTYKFGPPSSERLAAELVRRRPIREETIAAPPDINSLDFISQYFGHSKLPARDIEQQYDLLRTIASVWEYRFPIQLPYMLPWIETFHSRRELTRIEFEKISNKYTQYRINNWDGNGNNVPAKLSSYIMKIQSIVYSDAIYNDVRSGSTIDDWLRRYFRAEASGRGLDGDRWTSVLRDYPRIVAQAGKMHEQRNDTKADT